MQNILHFLNKCSSDVIQTIKVLLNVWKKKFKFNVMQFISKHCNNMSSCFYINQVYLHREMLKSLRMC